MEDLGLTIDKVDDEGSIHIEHGESTLKISLDNVRTHSGYEITTEIIKISEDGIKAIGKYQEWKGAVQRNQ